MDMSDDDITALYDWGRGACFRCAEDRQTARVSLIATPSGAQYEIRACRTCLLVMETESRLHAERVGRQYTPGQLGMRDDE